MPVPGFSFFLPPNTHGPFPSLILSEMKIVLLTTQTTHHTYFVKKVLEQYALEAVFLEEQPVQPPFEVNHPFEAERETYERDLWFEGKAPGIADLQKPLAYDTMNNADAVGALAELGPDVAVVFGTGKLNSSVIAACPAGIINLHGGDPEEYRGLDSHLWAIYHSDFGNLITTLHCLNDELDDGAVIGKQALAIRPGMPLKELRSVNTEACLSLALNALATWEQEGRFHQTAQRKKGRYYSFMPAVLKNICQRRFSAYTREL
ncbi:formyltransferase family protein [Fibrobacterota bacterium]